MTECIRQLCLMRNSADWKLRAIVRALIHSDILALKARRRA